MGVEGHERYINPYTDFGFKKLFGTELNKDLLISFLNALFADSKKEIKDLKYLNSEHLGDGYADRRAVFDVYCETEDGGRFIVEMQKAEQEYFKDRSVYYATYPIREQAPKGTWDYHLEGVFTVGILNFTFPDDEYPADRFMHEVKLKDVEDNHVFYDKLTFIYLEMPKFSKTEDELVTMFDKWMFALRNLSRLMERPAALQERTFKRLFEQAEIAGFTPQERKEYQESVKDYWDYYSTMKTAHKQGVAEGMEKGLTQGRAEGLSQGRAEGLSQGRVEEKKENARRMKARGFAVEDISEITGLSAEEIEVL